MSMRKLTKLAGMSLSGLLIASFIVMSAGLLFALAPANPVSAAELVVTRHLPDTVVPGETFEVTVTFTAPDDDFRGIGLEDYAPVGWDAVVAASWSNPDAELVLATDNKVEIGWALITPPYPAGTSFTAVYRVQVPDAGVLPGFYDFGTGQLEYRIGGPPAYTAGVIGKSQVEITKPDEVWVNDDWAEGYDPGDQVPGGYIFGYNAFATIQDGIEGVADSTVHVLPGNYDGFIVEDRTDLSIIGHPGARVVSASIHYYDASSMALVLHSTNIAISGLEFICNETGSDLVVGIFYLGSTGSIDGVDVIAEEVYSENYGIVVASGVGTTVDISTTTVEGWMIGIYAYNDHVNVSGCTIIGSDGGGISIGLLVFSAVVNVEGTTIRDCWTGDEPNGGPLELSTSQVGDVPAVHQMPFEAGVGVLSYGPTTTTHITGCSKIENNDVGIVVRGGYLEVSGSNIEGNHLFGIYNEGVGNVTASSDNGQVNATTNWWGAPTGPFHDPDNLGGTGDEVSDGVIFYPWLDAPCPDGTPVGPAADFVGVPRTGTAPLTVEFTDLSQGAPGVDIVSWFWEFGDGATSSEQHPTHTYTHVGTYRVSLTITDELDGSHTLSRPAYITVVAEPDEEEERERRRPHWITPRPAQLMVTSLLVIPEQVQPNQQVEVFVGIANSGGTVGTHEVNLYVNGHFEGSHTVSVAAGSSSDALFTVIRSQPGTYHVSVDGHTGQFTVVGTTARHWGGPLGTGGVIAIIVVAIALALGLVFVFRRQ